MPGLPDMKRTLSAHQAACRFNVWADAPETTSDRHQESAQSLNQRFANV
jgi:hypothetical protein